jgi:hypothetical protein
MLSPAQTLQRQPTKKPFVVTIPHDKVLQGVYTLQLATCEQVRELLGYSKNSKERVQKLVKQLTDNGYLLSDCVPTKKAKSPISISWVAKAHSIVKRWAWIFVTTSGHRLKKTSAQSFSPIPCPSMT